MTVSAYPTSPVPQYTFVEESGYKTLVSQFENGVEQRRQKWSRSKKTFTLNYGVISRTAMGLLKTHFDSALGSALSFTFVNPLDSASYTCRYVEDTFNCEQHGKSLVRVAIKLIEVF
jgi:uncharacterized protein (TIGR02217 family)